MASSTATPFSPAVVGQAANNLSGGSAYPAAHAGGLRPGVLMLVRERHSAVVLRHGHLGQGAREALQETARKYLVEPNFARGLGEWLVAPEAADRKLPRWCPLSGR